MSKGVTYQAMVEYLDTDEVEHKFFTNLRVIGDSPKTIKEAEDWITDKMRNRGTLNVRATLSRVVWSIVG